MANRIKPNTTILILLLFFAIFGFLVFYTYVRNVDDCEYFGKIQFIDTATVGGKVYTLVTRQTGFQDKIQFLLLYPGSITFDSCGKPKGDALDNEIIEDFQDDVVQWPEKIEIKDNQIIIHYTKEKDKYKPLVDVPVIWHQN